jgi:hypothetical protein
MSDERRKRQVNRGGETEAKSPSRNRLIGVGIVVALIAGYAAFWYHNNHQYDEFARCLAGKQAKMYGLYWCPHCAEQKEMFGRAFQYVPYVECGIKGSHEMAGECTAAGVKLFPSWQFAGGKPIEGVFPMQELSDKTGCVLP